MLSCWDENPDKRPTFLLLHSSLNQLNKENQVLNANVYKRNSLDISSRKSIPSAKNMSERSQIRYQMPPYAEYNGNNANASLTYCLTSAFELIQERQTS